MCGVLQVLLTFFRSGLCHRHDDPAVLRAGIEDRHVVGVPAKELRNFDLSPHPRCRGLTLGTTALERDDRLGCLVYGAKYVCLPALVHGETVQAVVLAFASSLGPYKVVPARFVTPATGSCLG